MKSFMRLGAVIACLWAFADAIAAPDPATVARGRYLVETILACGNCHTPKAPDGQPIASRALSGGGLTFDLPPFAGTASNITPDVETGIGSWTDTEIKRAITLGERPRHGRLAGQPLGAPMWVNFYRALTPGDLDAVVAYLRSVPAVRNDVPLPTYRKPVAREPYPDGERSYSERDLLDPVKRGQYLVTIGHCMECHTPIERGVTLYGTRLGNGGRSFTPTMVQGFPAAWTGAVSRNVTSHRTSGLGDWTDSEIQRAIGRGIGRDGRALQPPMAYAWYAGLAPQDLDAIVAWLRTVPPLP